MNRSLFIHTNTPFLLFDEDGGVGTPAPATPAPATPGAPAAAPATPSAGTPAPATGGVPEGYVPSYRLREQREQILRESQSTWATKEAEMRAESERYRAQVLALTGVTAPPDPAIANVRGQFGQLYPGLAALEEHANELLALREQAGSIQQQQQHYWESYGRSTMDSLYKTASDSLGPLNDEAKRQLHTAFVGFVQSSPEMIARYERDPSIVTDFWKQFTSSFIDPVRRTAAAGIASRAPGALPQDTPGGVPQVPQAPKMNSLDERVAAGWAKYNTGT